MKGDRVEIVIDSGDGTQTYEVAATKAGRRVDITNRRGIVEVSEVTRTGTPVRTARFMASRVVALVEYPADTPAGLACPDGASPAGDPPLRVGLAGTAIAELQGRPVPAPGPEAELWMGAHPSAPSGVAADHPGRRHRGRPGPRARPGCVARFGPRLPFLLKVLSADQALSIQVHPSRAQAEAGFRAENERGLPPDDPARNYVDDWPKPELLCALTPFEVLAGLRSPSDAAALLRALAVGPLAPLAAELAAATAPQALAARWPPS